MSGTIDRERVERLGDRAGRHVAETHTECARLLERGRRSMPHGVGMSWFATTYGHAPLFAADGSGPRFRCADGIEFLDMGLAILSAFAGYTPSAVRAAVEAQLARGTQFALPGTGEAALAESLADRWGLPAWQFTLSATLANLEVIRVARARTGRPNLVLFDGKFHGYLDATLQVVDGAGGVEPEYLGLGPESGRRTRIVPFNDLAAVEAALADRSVAAVLTEPAILNARTILPHDGFHAGLRDLTRAAGSLLVVDETYTLTSAYGGLTRAWGLDPDLVVLGKSLGGGLPLAAWGMTAELAGFVEAPTGTSPGWGDLQFTGRTNPEVATGGTLTGNALSIAAGRAMVDEVLTPATYERTHQLADVLEAGIARLIEHHRLPWTTLRLANRAGYWWTPTPPRNAAEQRAGEDEALSDAIRLALLERGVFEAGGWANPTVGAAHSRADIDAYLGALGDVLAELMGEASR